jgi:hypothetical protein
VSFFVAHASPAAAAAAAVVDVDVGACLSEHWEGIKGVGAIFPEQVSG